MRLLYLSQVRWDWIKQRPQFLAEELSAFYDITVVIQRPFFSKKQELPDINIKFKTLWRLPYGSYKIIGFINRILNQLQLMIFHCRYDVIWFSSPLQYPFMKDFLEKKHVVYDCMDDMLEFHKDDKLNKMLRENEKQLIDRANTVICSSSYLREKLIERYGEKRIMVVNNAIESDLPEKTYQLPPELSKLFIGNKFNVTYIGTISEWVDLNLMKKITKHNPNIVFYLFGPLCVELPSNDNIKYCGTIDHQFVFPVMEHSDALIMPFVVNELIKSVNPVKLYEYIYSGKPCLAPRYSESEFFSDYVYLYDDIDECSKLIDMIEKGEISAKKSLASCRLYSKNNSWTQRALIIRDLLK